MRFTVHVEDVGPPKKVVKLYLKRSFSYVLKYVMCHNYFKYVS